MIDFTLREARQKRYGYAAQHLVTCADIANRIEDFAPIESHELYVARLRAAHSKKTGFWGQLACRKLMTPFPIFTRTSSA